MSLRRFAIQSNRLVHGDRWASELELRLDRAAEKAMLDLHTFRNKHWEYFTSTPGRDARGVVIPRVKNKALDREAFRLHQLAIDANKAAADAEYNATYGA